MTHRTRRRILLLLAPAALVAVGACYYVADPATADGLSRYMPRCLWHDLTGWTCPACGLQRALHASLHGHLAEALSYNYFFIISLPLLLAALAAALLLPPRHWLSRAVSSPWTGYAYVVLLFVWWIARNVWNV